MQQKCKISEIVRLCLPSQWNYVRIQFNVENYNINYLFVCLWLQKMKIGHLGHKVYWKYKNSNHHPRQKKSNYKNADGFGEPK